MADEAERDQLLTARDCQVKEVCQTVRRRGKQLAKVCCTRYFLKSLLLGQFISLLLCGTAVSTGLLQEQGVNIPTAQSFFNYVLLCMVFTTILVCRREGRSMGEVLRSWGWRYILIAVVDVEANYLVVKAYAYTTVTSVQLLDCFSLVSVIILSRIFLRARYRLQHLIGAGVCLLGMTGLVLTDVLVGKNDNQASNIALGDVLIIVGATLYGVSNVCEEYVVRTYDKVEFLAMVGLFGSFINGAQFLILERDEISTLDLTSYKTVVPLLVFVLCLFTLYSCMTVVIQLTSATTVNMSILSADFYTLLFGLFLFNYKFHVLYFVAFAVIILGLAVYSATPTQLESLVEELEVQVEGSHLHHNQTELKVDSNVCMSSGVDGEAEFYGSIDCANANGDIKEKHSSVKHGGFSKLDDNEGLRVVENKS